MTLRQGEDRTLSTLSLPFGAGIVLLLALRVALGWDLSIHLGYSPHDDSLYTERAAHLLVGEAFGPYDSRVLTKYPGLSLWMAGMHSLGVPFSLSVEVLYIAAGIYLLLAFAKTGASRWALLAGLALYLFNPMTFGDDWLRIMREPLDTALFVAMVAAMAHVLARVHARAAWSHLAVFCVLFAFSMFVREENRLLWALLALFFVALLWQAKRLGMLDRRMVVFLFATAMAPALLAKTYEHGLRKFVEANYGLPIIHDYAEGEFPRLLAAIRSIESVKDNRMVMVTQERLEKLEKEVPAFAPVIERLPKPGPRTFSCLLHGVCSEWSNGWMPFWIKDAAFTAGLTPTLGAAQDYFRRVATQIENACASGRLRCVRNGDGFVPPMELRWISAYVGEAYRLVRMALAPELHPKVALSQAGFPEETRRRYDAMDLLRSEAKPSGTLAEMRAALLVPHQIIAAIVLLGFVVALAARLWIADQVPLAPLAMVGLIVGLYGIVRLAALAYVAVYLGPFISRIVFSTYAISVLIALPFIAETVSAWRRRMPPAPA